MIFVEISPFSKGVLNWIKKIPKGKVATYKQIALLAGKEQGSRGVAWILKSCSRKYKLPWHRVINSKGKISFDPQSYNFKEQKRRLVFEGIEVSREGNIDLVRSQWKKFPSKSIRKRGQPKIFS